MGSVHHHTPFQFYLSSIKSKILPYCGHGLKGFNSTLVQLKVQSVSPNELLSCSFNSTLVQLKEEVVTAK